MSRDLRAAAAIGLILFLVCLLVVLQAPGWVADIDATITLATSVLGFALAVFGAVKSGFAVTSSFGATTLDVVPSGATAVAGAALLIASQILGA
jgi:hypothetical protein